MSVPAIDLNTYAIKSMYLKLSGWTEEAVRAWSCYELHALSAL